MSQSTPKQTYHDVHVRIPFWLIKLIALNMAIWMTVVTIGIFFSGQIGTALMLWVIGLLWIPVQLFLMYLFWRFYWWITAFTWVLGSLFALLMVMVGTIRITTLGIESTLSDLQSLPPIALPVIALVVVVLVFIVYLLTRRRPEPVVVEETRFIFSEEGEPDAAPRNYKSGVTAKEFQVEVARLIDALTNYRAEAQGGIREIYVYQKEMLVGLVICKLREPDQFLAPMFVRDVHKRKEALNVKFAYLVTNARFNTDTEAEAKRYGIRLIDGEALKQMQQRAGR